MDRETERLFSLDAALRAEGDQMLSETGLGALLAEAGYHPVGSYAMRTMTWRDLDYHRYGRPEWEEQWEFATRLAGSGACYRLTVEDFTEHPSPSLPRGIYIGARVFWREQVWKLDLWTALREEFPTDRNEVWQRLLTEDKRARIPAIKEAICDGPQYRRTILSIDIYEAVLERDITTVDDFLRWCEQRTKAE
jgi:hypothetical protein